ncbi:unnamed protein product [Prorocentrum cordatum]|uniref:Uncharacterized protein n=1 Tax=Prorocentrum cordatum TaxID=2364126 RepID=A0ABN9W272_9DINO|nr:unnamed protein product [Polarella glacialis]
MLLTSPLENSYPVNSTVTLYSTTATPTSSPTGSPTRPPPAPTPAPTPPPTPRPPAPGATPGPTGSGTGPKTSAASGAVSASGDPHMVNIYGQRFDLMQPGRHTLLRMPRAARRRVLLRVSAAVEHVGPACMDVYIVALNITGRLAETGAPGGLHFSAAEAPRWEPLWREFGRVRLKVVHGRTREGIPYLNVLVRNLRRAGYPVGGILGEDDHTAAATPPANCKRMIAL